ncbi:MAG: 2-keto-4-pentenoate hydratase [Pseudomonadota bacterium]
MSGTSSLQSISERFIAARLTATPLSDFPGELPATLSDAYAIQDLSIAAWADAVAGWKVGGIPSHLQEKFGESRVSGPIFRRTVHQAGDTVIEIPVFDGGFAAVEGEIVLQTDRDIPPGSLDADSDEVVAAVPSAFIGVELASSPLGAINDLGPPSVISDFGNNAALIVGDPIDDWGPAIAGRTMTVSIDGATIGTAPLAPLEDGAIGAFRFLLKNCAARGITLPKGTFVSTGAVTGVHQASVGATAEVSFEGMRAISLRLAAIEPR